MTTSQTLFAIENMALTESMILKEGMCSYL